MAQGPINDALREYQKRKLKGLDVPAELLEEIKRNESRLIR
jgi:hypothetical protein